MAITEERYSTAMDPKADMPEGFLLRLEPVRPSRPLRALTLDRTLEAAATEERPARKPLRGRKERQPVAEAIDPDQIRNRRNVRPASRVASGAPAAPPPSIDATFIGGLDDGTSIPPDVAGAVGPHHVFSPLNNDVRILDRSGALLLDLTLDQFWSLQGLEGGTFDPRAVYDPGSERFYFTSVADAQSPTSRIFFAWSETSDPTGLWGVDEIHVDEDAEGAIWFDFPSIGFSADKVTIQVNLFSRINNRFAGSSIYVIDKDGLNSPPYAATLQRFTLRNQGGTHCPAFSYDDEKDQYLVSRWSNAGAQGGSVMVHKITGTVSDGRASIVRLGLVNSEGPDWNSFAPGDFAPQRDSDEGVDAGDDRMLGVVLRNGKLFCVHAIMLPAADPTRSSIQAWCIDAVTQDLIWRDGIDDDEGGVFHAYPSLAVNKDDVVCVGMARFSARTHPSGAVAVKRPGQAFSAPQVYAPGQAVYVERYGGHSNRWGDYTVTQVDPVDDLAFWTSQEFAAMPRDTWSVSWARVRS